MDWKQISREFEVDGSLRDILIFNTDLTDWQAVMDYLLAREPKPAFRIGEEHIEPPIDLTGALFRDPDTEVPTMYIPLGSATLNCHFFSDHEIEFDLDPKEMSHELLKPLSDFMRGIGNAADKPVFLTHEGDPSARILEFDPVDDQVRWVGPAYGELIADAG